MIFHPAHFYIMVYNKHTLTDFILDHIDDVKWFSAKRFLNAKISSDLIDSLISTLSSKTICYILGSYYRSTKIFLESDKINDLLCKSIDSKLRSGLDYFMDVIQCKNNSAHNSSQCIHISKSLSEYIFKYSSARLFEYKTLSRVIFNFETADLYLNTNHDLFSVIIRDYFGTQLDDVSKRTGNTIFDVFYYDQFKNNKKLISLFVYNYAFDSCPITNKMLKMIFNKDLFNDDDLKLFAREILRGGSYYRYSFHNDGNPFAFSKTFINTILPYVDIPLMVGNQCENVFIKLLKNNIPPGTIVNFINTSSMPLSYFCKLSGINDDDLENVFINNRRNRSIFKTSDIETLLETRPLLFAKYSDLLIESLLKNYIKYQFPEKIRKYIDLDMIKINIGVDVDGEGIACLEELNK